jgi:hypothetical protein
LAGSLPGRVQRLLISRRPPEGYCSGTYVFILKTSLLAVIFSSSAHADKATMTDFQSNRLNQILNENGSEYLPGTAEMALYSGEAVLNISRK